jgi:hypothetical protein
MTLPKRWLEIDEVEFTGATRGAFKPGIEFVSWGVIGTRHRLAFGKIGQELGGKPFQGDWRRCNRAVADRGRKEQVAAFPGDIEGVIRKCVPVMPKHAEFIASNCAARP